MSFFQKLLTEAIKSLLTQTDTVGSSKLSTTQENSQSDNNIADAFAHNHAIYCKWCEIESLYTRKLTIADYLSTLNTASYERLQANLEQMKENVMSHIKQHEANEKFAWGKYIEDQIAYQNAKLRTGARDPKFLEVLNQYKVSLETVCWTIQICSDIRKAIILR
jgi:hypothetical protein